MNVKLLDILEKDTRPVAILGAGVSGCAVQKLLSNRNKPSVLFDPKKQSFSNADAAVSALIVQSPGFSPGHEWIKIAKANDKEVFSEVDVGLSFSNHAEFVAITGTNGKTSLTSILGHICKILNIENIEVGNIGKPLSEAVATEDLRGKVVFHETSSFQSLSSHAIYPDSVLWTNFAPDHIDYHGTEKAYFLAKFKLAENCRSPENVFIGSSVVQYAQKYGLKLNPKFTILDKICRSDLPENIGFFHQSIPQLENLAFAIKWLASKGVSKTMFFEALQSYEPYPYRLQKVCEINDVSFWNDSKSTNLASTKAACKSFEKKVIWIGGGKEKGEELTNFSDHLSPYLHKAILIGDSARELFKLFNQIGIKVEICETLRTAIQKAYDSAKRYSDILFSPGFASFDMFSNYMERGNSFNSLVFDLKSSIQVSTKLSVNNFHASH